MVCLHLVFLLVAVVLALLVALVFCMFTMSSFSLVVLLVALVFSVFTMSSNFKNIQIDVLRSRLSYNATLKPKPTLAAPTAGN